MDADLKKKWIADLRSEKYKQGTGRLNQDGRLCCLGVLCETAELKKVINGSSTGYQYTADDEKTFNYTLLPEQLADQLDIDQREILMKMNDTDSRSFVEIADWIEENIN